MEIPPGVGQLFQIIALAMIGRVAIALMPEGGVLSSSKSELPALWAASLVVGRMLLEAMRNGFAVSHFDGSSWMVLFGGSWALMGPLWILLSRKTLGRLPPEDQEPPESERSPWANNLVGWVWVLGGLGIGWALVKDRIDEMADAVVVTTLLLEGLRILRVHANARAVLFPILAAMVCVDSDVVHLIAVQTDGLSPEVGQYLTPGSILFLVGSLAWVRSGDRRGLTLAGPFLLGSLIMGGTACGIGVATVGVLIIATGPLRRTAMIRSLAGWLVLAILSGVVSTIIRAPYESSDSFSLFDPSVLHEVVPPPSGLDEMLFALAGGGSGTMLGNQQRYTERVLQEYLAAWILVGVLLALAALRQHLLKRRLSLGCRIWLIGLPLLYLAIDPAGGQAWPSRDLAGFAAQSSWSWVLLLGLWVLTPHDEPRTESFGPTV